MHQVILAFTCVYVLPTSVAAAMNNRDAPVIQCMLTSGEKCLEGRCTPIESMKKIKLPLKVGIERGAGVIAATDIDGWPMVSRITSTTHEPGQLVLQGVGFGIGWTMAVEAEGSRATATLSAADGVSILFGTCNAEPE
jgi:hypothetical protein